MNRRRIQIALAIMVCGIQLPAALRAQGTLSTQGLGYPTGQLATPTQAAGGANAEIDPISPLNPAALGLFTSPILYMQAEPEYREIAVGGEIKRTSVHRFPLFVGAVSFGPRWNVGLAASTLLDRTWATTTRDTQFLASDTIGTTVLQKSDGSIEDVRLAGAYSISETIRIGLGLHALTGRAALTRVRSFDDTARFASDTLRSTIGFGGKAISVGVQATWPGVVAAGMSYRRGGRLRAYSGNTVLGSGSAPDHFGVSVGYIGIEGTVIGVRAARDGWSRTRGVAPTLNVHEGWDVGVGADVAGPKFGNSPVALRAGARWRTLPFSTSGNAVKERTLSGGFGFPFAGGLSELHFGGMYSTRSGDAIGASERAWTLSTGFAIRP